MFKNEKSIFAIDLNETFNDKFDENLIKTLLVRFYLLYNVIFHLESVA